MGPNAICTEAHAQAHALRWGWGGGERHRRDMIVAPDFWSEGRPSPSGLVCPEHSC